MKKIWMIPLLLSTLPALAQQEKIWGDPHVVEKFAAEAVKDSAYIKFRAEVEALSKTASGSKTNAAAVRSLFVKNGYLLSNLYTKANVDAPKAMNVQKQTRTSNKVIIGKAMPWYKLMTGNNDFIKVETPPYDATIRMSDEAGLNNMYPDTSGSQFPAGITRMIYLTVPNPNAKRKTGQYLQGFSQSFTVPTNPAIIAAEVKFEYSYFYTGWDTYGANVGMDLAIEANDKITGPEYNALPEYVSPNGVSASSTHRWKLIAELYPFTTIVNDFTEFHSEGNNESFTFGGYVTPGSTFNLKMVMGFKKNTTRGLNGSYHYAEFILKKITVKYFKTAN
jgi:hypothetical protein